jgi:hypothetical protein
MFAMVLILLIAVVVFLSIWLLKQGITSGRVLTVFGMCSFIGILSLFDPEALTSAKIGPMEIKQDLEKARRFLDEIKSLKTEIDSTALHVFALGAKLDSTMSDMRQISKLNSELSILQVWTRNRLGHINEPVLTRIITDINRLTRFAEPDVAQHQLWLRDINAALVQAGESPILH